MANLLLSCDVVVCDVQLDDWATLIDDRREQAGNHSQKQSRGKENHVSHTQRCYRKLDRLVRHVRAGCCCHH
jgi:hypothetical protein